jgi:protein NEDD1
MVDRFQFASSGDDVKIWDINRLVDTVATPLLSFRPHLSVVNSVRWNHNNQVLASAGQDGNIFFSHVDGRRLGSLPVKPVPGSPPITSIEFGGGSRYLGCGEGKTAVVWDLKKKEKSQSFRDHKDTVTSVVFGANDTRLASCSLAGEILVHSLLSGQKLTVVNASQLRSNDGGLSPPRPLHDLQFSPHNKGNP